MSQNNLQLKAAQSYWTAKRDQAQSKLDIYLNKSVGTGVEFDIQERINQLFEEFSHAQNVLNTVNLIIDGISKQSSPDINNPQ